jgi:hypothetical protein
MFPQMNRNHDYHVINQFESNVEISAVFLARDAWLSTRRPSWWKPASLR